MTIHVKSVTEQVWSNIITYPDQAAALIPNEGPAELVLSTMPVAGAFSVINVRPDVLAVSWREYGHMVAEATLFLKGRQVKRGDRLAILGWDSLEWMVVNRAAQCLGAVIVPIYPNTNQDQVAHILNDSGASLIVCESARMLAEKVNAEQFPDDKLGKALFADVLAGVGDYTGKTRKPGQRRQPLTFRPEAIAEFERLVAAYTTDGGEHAFAYDDVSSLIYTSGSTSLPKGAMLTHKNVAAACALLRNLGFDFSIDNEDIMLHYLPFGHVYGKVDGVEICECFGVTSCFCTPETMKEALRLYRPTLLLGVPRVWNRIKAEIERKATGNGLTARVLRWALNQKQPGFKQNIARSLVFPKIRKEMGTDRVRLTLSGSASIPMETVEFFNLIGLALREGYGLTETCGGFAASTLADYKYNSLGKPGPGAEIRLEKREQDTEPNTGVLWVRGDFVFAGYWRRPEKNAEVFDADGWFNTSDIVHLDADGFLWYRGRASRQKKLDTGKFYSEETIQVALEANPLIEAAVPTGEGKPFVGALIFLEPAAARKLAGAPPAGVDPAEFYARNTAVFAAVANAVAQANKGLQSWETVKQWAIVPVQPTVDNGLLTPTLKIRSEEALKRYAPIVDSLYARKR